MADKRTTKKTSSKKPAKKQAAKKQAAKKQPRGLKAFYRETMGELRKVSWPTREEALSLTKVVIFVMVIMAIVLGGLDWGFFKLFDIIFTL